MKIVADENIPFVMELFSLFGEVVLSPGRLMDADLLEGADILLVRSVTKVNEALLSKSNVKFVGTCTIGTDHLDKAYLDSQNIAYTSAPGCNANSVVQYAVTALAYLDLLDTSKKVAVVGYGNVGSRLYAMLKALGFDCRCVDPFKTKDDCVDIVAFDDIFDADIICVHTPYTRTGPFPTEKMFSTHEFQKMKSGALLLNGGRGQVVDNDALLDYLSEHNGLNVVLDVWQEEPDMNTALFQQVQLGSPHIAGYSFEGRINGSTMIFEALASFLKLDKTEQQKHLDHVTGDALGAREEITAGSLREAIGKIYDIKRDHDDLAGAQSTLPGSFDVLRKTYHKRREFSHFECVFSGNDEEARMLKTLGFIIN